MEPLNRYDPASHGDPGYAGGSAKARADSSGKRLRTPQFGHERKNAPGRAGLESAKSGSFRPLLLQSQTVDTRIGEANGQQLAG